MIFTGTCAHRVSPATSGIMRWASRAAQRSASRDSRIEATGPIGRRAGSRADADAELRATASTARRVALLPTSLYTGLMDDSLGLSTTVTGFRGASCASASMTSAFCSARRSPSDCARFAARCFGSTSTCGDCAIRWRSSAWRPTSSRIRSRLPSPSSSSRNGEQIAADDDWSIVAFVTPGVAGAGGPTVCVHGYPLQFRALGRAIRKRRQRRGQRRPADPAGLLCRRS